MWLLFLVMDVWLTGTVFVPFLLLVLWVATKWKRLGWLNTSRRRWVRIWGLSGGIKVVGIVWLIWIIQPYSNYTDGGWTGKSVARLVWVFSIPISLDLVQLWLILFVTAFAVAVEDGCLAALAWWFWERVKSRRVRMITIAERYFFSLLASAWVLGIANVIDFKRPRYCDDCLLDYGVPFHFFQAGGFVGILRFVGRGVMADFLLAVGVGVLAGLVWNVVSRRRVATHTGMQ